MGRSVPVKTGGWMFASGKEAERCFLDQRADVSDSGKMAGGAFFDQLKTLFTLCGNRSPGRLVITCNQEVTLTNDGHQLLSIPKTVDAMVKSSSGSPT